MRMSSGHEIGPISQQYAAAATVPLIKSPSLWLPKPVELPNDIHPLPEDITAYFVYPFTLEQHVLSLQPSPHDAISERRARNAAILHQREVEEEQREKEALHKVAPGYNPSAVLMPTSKATHSPATSMNNTSPPVDLMGDSSTPTASTASAAAATISSDPMDDLVSRLEEMESKR